METVYLETTIVGHIAGRLHPNPFVAARQQATRDWWKNHAPNFAVDVSQLVVDESSAGDPAAAEERLVVIEGIDLLANATLRGKIERICRDAGYEPPIICTPQQLMETEDDS